jgi:hypothetical protein
LAIAEKMAFAETCHTKCTQQNGLAVSVTDEKIMVENKPDAVSCLTGDIGR